MPLPPAPRRPYRVVAAALLMLLHLVAIELFVHLRTTRERSDDRLVTLELTTSPPSPRAPAPKAPDPSPIRAPRPLLAPLPPVDVAPLTSQDSAAPIAAAESPAGTPGVAASASGPGRLDLAIPREFYAHPPALTPAQEAMRDPRSNRLVLTKQEQMDVDFGVVECIAWQREPDGSIYRGPGRWQRVHGVSSNPFHAHKPGTEDRSLECVR